MSKAYQHKKETSFWQKIILILFGVFLTLLFMEIGLRAGGAVLLYLQQHRNELALKQKGTYRIMCIGESTTQGQYPPFLQDSLNKRNIGIKFSVIDKGFAACNTSFLVSQLESNLFRYNPDMVVAMMGINDGGTHIPFEQNTTSKAKLFFRSMRTYKLMRMLGLHIFVKLNRQKLARDKEKAMRTNLLSDKVLRDKKDSSAQDNKCLGNVSRPPEEIEILIGHKYWDNGDFIKAESHFKKALSLNKECVWALAELGYMYLGLGTSLNDNKYFDQAECLFNRLLEVNPRSSPAFVGLGWIYVRNQLPRAEECFERAIELGYKEDFVFAVLGDIYRRQGKFSKAQELLLNSANMNTGRDRSYGALATLNQEVKNQRAADEFYKIANDLRQKTYNQVTRDNYLKLKKILDKHKVVLACVQYAVRNIEPLENIFDGEEGIIFVDNERVFKKALREGRYKDYFTDMFGGDFGHCTEKGNKLLAQNIADVILKEVFSK